MYFPQIAAGIFRLATASSGTPQNVAIEALSHEISSWGSTHYVFCISIDGTDAPSTVISRLGRTDRKVVKASECVEVSDAKTGSYHRQTGMWALFVRVGGYKRLTSKEAEVHVWTYAHGMEAGSGVVELRLVRGKWRVWGTRNQWAT